MVGTISQWDQKEGRKRVSKASCDYKSVRLNKSLKCKVFRIYTVLILLNNIYDHRKFFFEIFHFVLGLRNQDGVLKFFQIRFGPKSEHVGLFCDLKVRIPERFLAFGELSD